MQVKLHSYILERVNVEFEFQTISHFMSKLPMGSVEFQQWHNELCKLSSFINKSNEKYPIESQFIIETILRA